jgi:hypothetical protein
MRNLGASSLRIPVGCEDTSSVSLKEVQVAAALRYRLLLLPHRSPNQGSVFEAVDPATSVFPEARTRRRIAPWNPRGPRKDVKNASRTRRS